MTNEQFDALMAAQLAQINLLTSIEANIMWIAQQQKPQSSIHKNWKLAMEEFKNAIPAWKNLNPSNSDDK
jgi:hypothetical protein